MQWILNASEQQMSRTYVKHASKAELCALKPKTEAKRAKNPVWLVQPDLMMKKSSPEENLKNSNCALTVNLLQFIWYF